MRILSRSVCELAALSVEQEKLPMELMLDSIIKILLQSYLFYVCYFKLCPQKKSFEFRNYYGKLYPVIALCGLFSIVKVISQQRILEWNTSISEFEKPDPRQLHTGG